ncbi:putative phage-encoded protein [Candidatus Desulfosporosinus infrequens]|uniref:Putative phage-encoded protein n=1 Tax=Candidatus Desulfosporosinus infrequens TaxID=2043169 RepID=A0A2U3LH39_9FIRM|nr:putative phage-encoded protein [Candidatus Desulfosporosinus infrequens]
MGDLVFLEPNSIKAIPFTTSDVIAEYAKIANRSVYLLIEKHQQRLEKFGRVSFEMTPFETKGGTQIRKVYHLNEEQATLLVTFLRNTETVIDFKTELVRQFYEMRTELQKRQIGKMTLKPTRKPLLDRIKENPNRSEWDYKLFIDLSYKAALGKIAASIRKERGADKKAVALDFMTSGEMELVENQTHKIAVLYELGFDYYQIRDLLIKKSNIAKKRLARG